MCGNLDRVDPQRAYGWVWDDETPSETKTIIISLDGQQVATCPASQFRDDLLAAGIGAGRYSFSVSFSDRHLEDGVHKVAAKVAGSDYQLPGSPRDYVVSRAAASEETAGSERAPETVKVPASPSLAVRNVEPEAPRARVSASFRDILTDAELRSTIQRQRLFDEGWYGRKYKLAFPTPDEALDHYLTQGMKHGFEPNALFDSKYYADAYLTKDGLEHEAFLHYLNFGAERGYWPSALIDPDWVAPQLQALGLQDTVLSAILHKASPLSIDPHPCFSVTFYLQQNPDVKRARSHPLAHYLSAGVKEMRSPHPLFWPKWMSTTISGRDMNASLPRYLQDADLFGVAPNPYFDVEAYRSTANLDQSANPLEHHLRHWRSGGASPNSGLDLGWAKEQYRIQLHNLRMDPLSFLVWRCNGFLKGSPTGAGLSSATNGPLPSKLDLRAESEGTRAVWDRRRRIIYFSHNLRIQGAQTSLFELASAFSCDPHNDVVVMAPDEGPMKDRYQNKNIPVLKYRLPVNGMNDGKEYQRLVDAFSTQINDLHPDIIHGNTVQTYHSISLGGRLGVPRVWNIRESEEPDLHFRDLTSDARALATEAFDSSAQFIFVSKTTEVVWKSKFCQIQSSVINNGVDGGNLIANPRDASRDLVRAALGVKPDESLLFNIGTWTERKGQLDLVQALQHIDRRLWRKLKIVLIGRSSGAYNDAITTSIQLLPLGLRERVQVYDESGDATARAFALGVFRAADLFVFTSRVESYPRVINEALFFGLPIVTTPCFGVVEQIVPDVDGLFYDAGDIRRLAGRIETLVADRNLRERLGKAALAASASRVMQFNEMVKRYAQTYQTISKAA